MFNHLEMSLFEIILLGVGLAMDCFAVSLSKGIAARRYFPYKSLYMALSFGLFQAGMPLIGYFAGNVFASSISKIAPWIALILLGWIGGKMVWEHFSPSDADDHADADYSIKTILILSVATSIDALATGVLFVGEGQTIWLAIGIIGLCSFFFSKLGTVIGASLGSRFRFPAELFGGLILIGIGLKIWLEGILL